MNRFFLVLPIFFLGLCLDRHATASTTLCPEIRRADSSVSLADYEGQINEVVYNISGQVIEFNVGTTLVEVSFPPGPNTGLTTLIVRLATADKVVRVIDHNSNGYLNQPATGPSDEIKEWF